MLTPYVSNEEVRSVLGVSIDELPDATLDQPLYETNLRFELESVSTSLPAAFATIIAVSPQSSLSDVQRQLRDAVSLFSPYAVAVSLATSLPLFAVKNVTDGKAGFTRNSAAPFADQIVECKSNYDRFLKNLQNRYAAFVGGDASSAPAMPAYLFVGVPSSDPVTGT